MKEVLAEETTTHPEGAMISVIRCRNKTKASSGPPYNEIRAATQKAVVVMRVDSVNPHYLRGYLELCLKQIEKERKRLEVLKREQIKEYDHPKDFREFVETMACNKMFILFATNVKKVLSARS